MVVDSFCVLLIGNRLHRGFATVPFRLQVPEHDMVHDVMVQLPNPLMLSSCQNDSGEVVRSLGLTTRTLQPLGEPLRVKLPPSHSSAPLIGPPPTGSLSAVTLKVNVLQSAQLPLLQTSVPLRHVLPLGSLAEQLFADSLQVSLQSVSLSAPGHGLPVCRLQLPLLLQVSVPLQNWPSSQELLLALFNLF